MVGRKGRCEADGARIERLRHHCPHSAQLSIGRLLAHRGLLAQDRVADRRVLRQHGNVGERALALDECEVLAKGLEFPARACEQRGDVHAFHHRQVAQQRLAERCRARGDAEAAVAHDHRRYAERDRGRERTIPGDLRVIVCMKVDDAGHVREAIGIDSAARRLVDLTGGDDRAVADPDRTREGFRTAAVVNAGAADQEI